MNPAKLSFLGFLMVITCISCFLQGSVSACTSIVLKAEDGTAVYGRTMEWGTFDLNSRLVIVPREHKFVGHTPDGKPGITWAARFGVVALDMIEKDYFADGMNEKGLVVGVLYHPGFAEYHSYNPDQANKTLGPTDLANYVLTQFATIEEVREGLKKIRVVAIPEPALGGIAAPIHLMVADQTGKAIAVEYLHGQLKIFDNPLRVLTNSPSFDWHMTNLRNYINLSAVSIPSKKIEDLNFAPIGAGSGFLGIPGDYTPPSRFVRAVAYTQTARKTPTSSETVYEVFRIMDNFNLPLGSAEGPDAQLELLKGMRSSTIWTTAADTNKLLYYYHTQHNRRVRMVDLKEIDFSPNKSGIKRFPLDIEKTQDIEDVTPK
jgi:choloylglycine hydrolase